MNTNNNNKKEIAILSIEIGNNQTKYLTIYNNSIPSKLAYNFCLEYNLDYDSLKRLTYEIKNLIEESVQKIPINKSFEKTLKKENLIQKRKNKSLNHSPQKTKENNTEIKKYNFKDITKTLKLPYEFEYKIQLKEKQDIKEENKENINYINKTMKNFHKKEINKSSYLSPTQSSKSKIKNQKKICNNNDIKIIKINNINKNKINFGEILYDKCMKMKKISSEKIKKEINLEQKKELDEFTFKPKINSINIKCFRNNYFKKEENSNRAEKKQTKKEPLNNGNIKENQIKKEKNKKKSNTERKQEEIPIYERLYNLQSQKKEEKKNNKDILFKPKINNNYKRNLNNKSFKERQKIYSAKSTERKKILEKQMYNKYDTKTGQKLFHPSINKNNYYNNKIKKYYNLSLDRKKVKMKTEQIKKEINNIAQTQSIFKANIKSDNIFENVIIKSFKKIFYALDNNFKGEISIFNYNTKNLPNSIKKIIEPILNHIDSTNKVFNQTQFVNECKKLYKKMDYYSKKEIYKFSEEKNNEQKKQYIFSKRKKNKEKNENNLINDNDKENENINYNKKFYANDYCINIKNSRIYKRFYNKKDFSKDKSTKYFENLIIQRDNIIL